MTGEVVALFRRLLLLAEIGLEREPYAVLQRGARLSSGEDRLVWLMLCNSPYGQQ